MTVPESQKCPVCQGPAWKGAPPARPDEWGRDQFLCASCGWPVHMSEAPVPVMRGPDIIDEVMVPVVDSDACAIEADDWARRTLKERDEARTERDEAFVMIDRLVYALLYGDTDRLYLTQEAAKMLAAAKPLKSRIQDVERERDEARTQRDQARAWARRWKQLAGQLREANKLGQICVGIAERQMEWAEEAHAEIARIKDRLGEALEVNANGCECECDCIQEPDGHEDDCDPCLACRVDAIRKAIQ